MKKATYFDWLTSETVTVQIIRESRVSGEKAPANHTFVGFETGETEWVPTEILELA